VGLDVGARRIGVAISDVTGTLARPVDVLAVASPGAPAVTAVAERLAAFAAEEDGVEGIVVGLPRRLDGSPNDMTARVEAFANALRSRTGRPVALQDERLTSVEAERLLAVRQKDWRVRKARLDAAAAAVILQDYLDARRPAEAERGIGDADADSQDEG